MIKKTVTLLFATEALVTIICYAYYYHFRVRTIRNVVEVKNKDKFSQTTNIYFPWCVYHFGLHRRTRFRARAC